MNAAQTQLLRRLAEAGTWLGRAELARGLDWTEGRVDDELADLVVAGNVMFNGRGNEYRLGGGPLARQALQRLLQRNDKRAHVLGRPDAATQTMRMGLALRCTDYTGGELLVMSEVEVPYVAKTPEGVQELVDALCAWQRAGAASQGQGA